MPALKKKLVYLDTSTISHIARALERKDFTSPWLRLFQRLEMACYEQVIICPNSAVHLQEAELARDSEAIIRMMKAFGNVSFLPGFQVKLCQLTRALDRYMMNETAVRETRPPLDDAFYSDVHVWRPYLDVTTNFRTPPESVEAYRVSKPIHLKNLNDFYDRYAISGANFEEIKRLEARGLGEALIKLGYRAMLVQAGLVKLPPEEDLLSTLFTQFSMLLRHLSIKYQLDPETRLARVQSFLEGDHAAMTPIADITSSLIASCALAHRFREPRKVRASDWADMEHIATHAPYVDILVADGFFADRCSQPFFNLKALYGTEVVSVGENQVDTFIERLDAMCAESPTRNLARDVYNSIEEGGYHQEFFQRAEMMLAKMEKEKGEKQ